MIALSDNMRGAALMVASMTFFTLNDACLKALGDEIPLMQALFLRGIAVTLLLGAFAQLRGGLRLDLLSADNGRLAVRTIAEVATAFFFLTALFNMPIANVTAILQVSPLAVTLAAALFLSESVGGKRLMAIGIGFFGVLLIVRPGTEGFSIYSVYVLCAVGTIVVRDLATRRMSRELPSVSVAFITSAGVTGCAGLASMADTWVPVAGGAKWQLAGSVVFVLMAYVCSVATMRSGDVGFVAPFRYTGLIMALIIGLIAFGEWPDRLTLVGSAIVVGTGMFTLLREQAVTRKRMLRESRGESTESGC
jgi:S-adenosylmethionine uptake transporter